MVAMTDAEGPALLEGGLPGLARRGDAILDAIGEGAAHVAHGADETLRIAWRADGGAKLHERRVEITDAFALVRQNLRGPLPELFARGRLAWVGFDPIDPAQNACDISI